MIQSEWWYPFPHISYILFRGIAFDSSTRIFLSFYLAIINLDFNVRQNTHTEYTLARSINFYRHDHGWQLTNFPLNQSGLMLYFRRPQTPMINWAGGSSMPRVVQLLEISYLQFMFMGARICDHFRQPGWERGGYSSIQSQSRASLATVCPSVTLSADRTRIKLRPANTHSRRPYLSQVLSG